MGNPSDSHWKVCRPDVLYRSGNMLIVCLSSVTTTFAVCRITMVPINDETDLIPRGYVLMASWHGVSMFFSIGRNGLSISQGLS